MRNVLPAYQRTLCFYREQAPDRLSSGQLIQVWTETSHRCDSVHMHEQEVLYESADKNIPTRVNISLLKKKNCQNNQQDLIFLVWPFDLS